MTTTLIICGISFLALASILYSKNKETKTGKRMLPLGSTSSDILLADAWDTFAYTVTHASKQSIKALAQRTIVSVERFFITRFERLGQKFTVVGNTVTGYNLPRNRGSVSFFLKNIESHKSSVQAIHQGTISAAQK